MEQGKIQLTFTCPVKWNSMSASEGGKYCSSCNKVVRDFTKATAVQVESVTEEHACGNFYATQLHKPYNDKRDVLVAYYQKITSGNASRKMLILFVTALMFLTGCRSHRRLSGAYAFAPPPEKQKTNIQTIQKQNVPK